MTTSDERIDSLEYADHVLCDMLHSDDVPKRWKEQIRMVLRHYPWPLYIELLRKYPPKGW